MSCLGAASLAPPLPVALQGGKAWLFWILQLQSSELVVVPSETLPLAPCALSPVFTMRDWAR